MDEKLLDLLQKFKGKHILIVGDIMLDKYIFGETTRVSQEASVKIVDVKKEEYALGGASNAANNILSLGGIPSLIGVVGDDEAGKILVKELEKKKITTSGIIRDSKRPTTQKIRVMNRDGQLIRMDYESRDNISGDAEMDMITYLKARIKEADAVIISDYAKGAITQNLIEKIKATAKRENKIIIIDPKQKDKSLYKDVDLITPNNKEACELSGFEETNADEIKEIGFGLVKDLNTAVLVTRGEKGMSLFEKGKDIVDIPTVAKDIKDVSGAGDTVAAAAALALAAGAEPKQAAILANHAAAIVVGKIGTATVTIDEIKKSLENE